MLTDWVVWVSFIPLLIIFMYAYTIDRPQNSRIFRREVHQLSAIRINDRNTRNIAKLYIR